MSQAEQIAILVNMNNGERRRFNAALKVLQRAGIDMFTAIDILLSAVKNQQVQARESRQQVR